MTSRILLQEACPASESLIWDIHRQAFMHEGAQAWLDYRIPYSVTSNIALARQKAQVIRKSFPALDGPIYVLELGAGPGFFAYHFLRAWQELDQAEAHVRPLRYLLTDFSRATLEQVKAQAVFQTFIASGSLSVCYLDAPQPQNLIPLHAPSFEMPPYLHAVIANYYACTLPTTLLRVENQRLEEKWCKTWLVLPEGFPDLTSAQEEDFRQWFLSLPVSQGLSQQHIQTFAQLSAHWSHAVRTSVLNWASALPFEWLTWLEESSFFESLACTDLTAAEQALLLRAAETLSGQVFPWPHGLWERLRQLETWLAPGALLLLSDKGYYVSTDILPADLAQPSYHGNTLAFPLHLELLADWLKLRNWHTAHTPYPFDPLQTLIAAWRVPAQGVWREAFATHFILQNLNLDAARLVRAAQDYQRQGEDQLAVGFYQKALAYRPGEPRIIHELVACLMRLGAFRLAEEFLSLPLEDPYQQFDFDYQWGQICFFQGRPGQALAYFQTSLEQQGEYASVYYNMALCHLALGQEAEAQQYLTHCLRLDPQHEAALKLQEHFKKIDLCDHCSPAQDTMN